MQGLTRNQIILAALLIAAAGAAAFLHVVATGLACAWDTSYCAHSVDRSGVYEGTLRTLDGEIHRSAPFAVSFESRRDLSAVSFKTDERGRFCIVWARESIYPLAYTPAGEHLSGRSGGEGAIPGITEWRDLEGRDPPAGCQEADEGIPWNRAEDATSTWQYLLLVLLPAAAALLLALALVGRRRPRARSLLAGGALLLGVDLVAGAILWGVP